MTATCNVTTVVVGTTIKISVSGSNGTAPYRAVVSDGVNTLLDQTGLSVNQVASVDVLLNVVGTYSFSGYVIDSCVNGSLQSTTETCSNIQVVTCTNPSCNFNISTV